MLTIGIPNEKRTNNRLIKKTKVDFKYIPHTNIIFLEMTTYSTVSISYLNVCGIFKCVRFSRFWENDTQV